MLFCKPNSLRPYSKWYLLRYRYVHIVIPFQEITTCTSANKYKFINCVCKLICSVSFWYLVGPCNPDPCQNGGRCTVNGADFLCLCDLGFIGTRCQGKSVIN